MVVYGVVIIMVIIIIMLPFIIHSFMATIMVMMAEEVIELCVSSFGNRKCVAG